MDFSVIFFLLFSVSCVRNLRNNFVSIHFRERERLYFVFSITKKKNIQKCVIKCIKKEEKILLLEIFIENDTIRINRSELCRHLHFRP